MNRRVQPLPSRRFYLWVVDPDIEARVERRLTPYGVVEPLANLCRPDVSMPDGTASDVLVVSPEILERAVGGEWPSLEGFLVRTRVILIVLGDDLSRHGPLLDLVDGWVFAHTQLAQLPKILRLSEAGYLTIPRSVAAAAGAYEDARASIGRLTARECAVLAELSRGWTENAIMSQLGLKRVSLKETEQSILDKLGVRNRFEAAAFAARHGKELYRARRRSIRGVSFVLAIITWAFFVTAGAVVAPLF